MCIIAGPAGSVLGNRLSENTKRNVLIIEAGGKYEYIVSSL
jgi:choline dehydrogenase-like flavoprotein